MEPERNLIRLGYIPLCDAAPLMVADALGIFADFGLRVELQRESSWSSLRDKVAVGRLEGAQMLAPLPLATTLGLGNLHAPLVTGLGLGKGGNAITLSRALLEDIAEIVPDAATSPLACANALARVVARRRSERAEKLRFAVVFPFSSHHYELRAWLSAASIDADRDVLIEVVPPTRMLASLSGGRVDGYAVGEPWNQLAASIGLGGIVCTSRALHGDLVEKMLAVRQSWADRHDQTHKALIKALITAAIWADKAENRARLIEILARPERLNCPRAVLELVFDRPNGILFHDRASGFPWRSQALWFLAQMRQAGQWAQADEESARRIADQVFRPDLYRLAALDLGLPFPLIDHKSEGGHDSDWTLEDATLPIAMGGDRLIDGTVFDPLFPFSHLSTNSAERAGEPL